MNPSPARPMPGGARSVLAWGPPHRAGECRTPDRLLKGPWRGRPSVHGRSSTQASHHPGDAAGNDAGSGILSVDELDRIARHRGLSIRLTSLGPAYRIACRDEGGAILGVTQGFKVPLFPILHADTMQVQRPRRMGAGGKPAGGPAPRFKRQGLHGLGLLLFVATLAHAAACGCQRIEMLAINDAGGGDFGWQKRTRMPAWCGTTGAWASWRAGTSAASGCRMCRTCSSGAGGGCAWTATWRPSRGGGPQW
ncbi:hypothetical protein ACKKBF_B16270 [Auxenochlorella protothecoides x Auxenochlorella symbiontica]